MTIQVAHTAAFSGALSSYLEGFRRFYPDIHEWFDRISGEFLTGNRRCLVACSKGVISGLAITRLGEHAKLCHVSVLPTSRDRGIGVTLMSAALSDILNSAPKDVCVTTSEEVYRNHGAFFASSGFAVVDWHPNRYRPGVSEIIWSGAPRALRAARTRGSATSTLVTLCSFGSGTSINVDGPRAVTPHESEQGPGIYDRTAAVVSRPGVGRQRIMDFSPR